MEEGVGIEYARVWCSKGRELNMHVCAAVFRLSVFIQHVCQLVNVKWT